MTDIHDLAHRREMAGTLAGLSILHDIAAVAERAERAERAALDLAQRLHAEQRAHRQTTRERDMLAQGLARRQQQ